MPFRKDGPVFADGKWMFPAQPPTYFVESDYKFRVRLRHVVRQEYSPSCVSEVCCEYHGVYASLSSRRPEEEEEDPRSIANTGCEGCRTDETQGITTSDGGTPKNEILKDLYLDSGVPLTERIKCQVCWTREKPIVLGVYCAWGDGEQIQVHSTAPTPEHLLLMRQRGVEGDYILVDFATPLSEREKSLSRSKSVRSLKRVASRVLCRW